MEIFEVESALKENANDFFSRAIAAYRMSDNKSAIINLWSAILLFLKIWIFRSHPSMIYSKWDKIIQYDNGQLRFSPFLSDGNFETVNYCEIKDRFIFLKNGSSLVFEYNSLLNNIRKKRNRVEHFIHDVDDKEILSMFAEVLPFINDFIEKELAENVSEFLSCWDDFLEIGEVYKHRLEQMKSEINAISPTTRDIQQGADVLIEIDCPNCDHGKLVNFESDFLFCKACEYKQKYIQCSRCAGIIIEDDFDAFLKESGMCRNCFNEICKADDLKKHPFEYYPSVGMACFCKEATII